MWDEVGRILEELRSQGWLVVLKCMPNNTPWIFEDTDRDIKIFRNWYADATFIKGRDLPSDSEEFQMFMWRYPKGLGDTPLDALTMLQEQIEDIRRVV
jgi:hypothetical protein